jgi:hypothetical protein
MNAVTTNRRLMARPRPEPRVGVNAPAAMPAHPGARPLVARRESFAAARDEMTRVFRTRSRGLVVEFGS